MMKSKFSSQLADVGNICRQALHLTHHVNATIPICDCGKEDYTPVIVVALQPNASATSYGYSRTCEVVVALLQRMLIRHWVKRYFVFIVASLAARNYVNWATFVTMVDEPRGEAGHQRQRSSFFFLKKQFRRTTRFSA